MSPPRDVIIKLPHPYLTAYTLKASSSSPNLHCLTSQPSTTSTPHESLHREDILFTHPLDPKSSDLPPDSNNTPWARARRSPLVAASWPGSSQSPTPAQLWLLVHAILNLRTSAESIRLDLAGPGAATARAQLRAVGLAIPHPVVGASPSGKALESSNTNEVLVLRSTFWQGAGSPFGPRPVWLPEAPVVGMTKPLSFYPTGALEGVMTNDPGTALCWHPRRPQKPAPGSVIYSRYVPHLGENFSMVALDYEDKEHLELFHKWQNDPRVSQGWNETGTLEQHREYLRKIDEDPHQITVLARFDDVCFAYFEIYWAKEDRLGAYYTAHDFDRGRHSLVGDVRFRGPHRVSAWWSSLMHYLYLDDPRTIAVVGEPKYTNSTVLGYDFIHGFGVDKFIDLPHKRSGLMHCGRERFFQLCPLAENEKVVGGTGVGIVPKL